MDRNSPIINPKIEIIIPCVKNIVLIDVFGTPKLYSVFRFSFLSIIIITMAPAKQNNVKITTNVQKR